MSTYPALSHCLAGMNTCSLILNSNQFSVAISVSGTRLIASAVLLVSLIFPSAGAARYLTSLLLMLSFSVWGTEPCV